MTTLNAKRKRWYKCRTRGKQRLWTPNWRYSFERQDEKEALYAKQKMNNDSGCYNEHVALNTKRKMINDSERQTKKVIALISKWKCGFELQNEDVALNAKPKENVAPNAKMRMQLWTPNEKCGSEYQTKRRCGSERQNEDEQQLWTPNEKCGSECQNEDVALNAKMKMWLWTPNRKKMWLWTPNETKHGSERRTEGEWWLWTLNWRQVVALNAKTKISNDFECRNKDVALNAKWNKTWLWTLN